MSAPQSQVTKVIGERVLKVEERYPGYRRDLLETLDEILGLQNDKPHNVAQQIARRLNALGEKLHKEIGSD